MTRSRKTTPRLIPTLRDDIARGGFFASLKREAREIEEFYLDEDERERLKKKGRVWRWFVLAGWVLKNSLYRLTSFRRILLVVGLFFVISDISYQSSGNNVIIQYKVFGAMCLVLVIILELKDKLLAHGELESGRAVQRAMSPAPTPSVPGWSVWLYTRSANEVGGDLVDFLRLDDHRFGVALGDVAGKGLGAALFMVKIQSTLRALAPDFESLGDLASKLNAILIRDGIPGKFASLIFARITSAAGDLQMVNAGHMPPLIVSPDGVTELPKGNAALGLSKDSVFEARGVRIIGGDSLVIYSDGITEAQNEAGEFFGLDRFKAVCRECQSAAPRPFGERVLAAVSAFEGDARRSDDLSLVILQKSV
ncbi:MAG: PP2C family protein-serine/threonine phosphatase [Bacteroidota bacterium]